MRRIPATGPLVAALVLACGAARAQPTSPSSPPSPHGKQRSLILQKEQLGTEAYASVGRARMRNNDCAGAIDAFDAAIAHSTDPTLRRDRGLCHEQLGHPYPAIDDYRAYLTAETDAADVEGIRGRLARLEQDTTGRSSQGDDADVPPADTGNTASVKVEVGGASTETGAGGAPASHKPRDPMDYVEHDNDQYRSPLRRGKGFRLAPSFSVHKWFFQNSNFGDSFTWAEVVGLHVGYSFGKTWTLFGEAGYQRFNSTGGSGQAQASISGLSSQIGLEGRFALDGGDYDQQLFGSLGLGFDHLVTTTNIAGAPSITAGALIPQARFGYRYMVAASAGLDFSLDAGLGKFASYSNPSDFPFGGQSPETFLLALNVALVWGL